VFWVPDYRFIRMLLKKRHFVFSSEPARSVFDPSQSPERTDARIFTYTYIEVNEPMGSAAR
jgi:hypothetical protein